MTKIARLTLSSTLWSALTSALASAVLIAMLSGSAAAQQHITGTLPDGATYVIDVPSPWNGALLLYSHGYVDPGAPNPALDVSDPYTGGYMLAVGYALAGSSYASTGWAVHEAIPDQIATLDAFESQVGTPIQTIAWGHSMGGEVTAALIQQYPDRFNAAQPMCGVLSGSVGYWNQALDQGFAFNALLAGGALQVVHITNPTLNVETAEAILAAAQASPQGQARIALVAALGDLPGWYDPTTPEPASTDYATQEANQFLWLQTETLGTAFAARAEVEFRAGGNPSFNTGVRYDFKLKRSRDYAEVQALYSSAGLSLDADLAALNHASRISADPAALTYFTNNVIFNGQITVPVLSLHTTGDGLVNVEQERAYRRVVDEADNVALLREKFIHRAGPRPVAVGTFFLLLGAAFLLDSFGVFRVTAALFWPLFVISLGAGLLLHRARRMQVEEDRSAQLAVAEERVRIARELHDIVAHGVSLMTIQIAAARRVSATKPESATESLEAAEQTGRETLSELEGMLTVLRGADASIVAATDRRGGADDVDQRTPLPRLADLPSLIDAVRQTGRTVAYNTLGEPPPLPASVEMVVYRLIQEALTNAVKYAGDGPVDVQVIYSPTAITVFVDDEGPGVLAGAGRPAPGGGGHGLVGMQERLAAIGGTLEAGPRRPGPGWRVHASIPVVLINVA